MIINTIYLWQLGCGQYQKWKQRSHHLDGMISAFDWQFPPAPASVPVGAEWCAELCVPTARTHFPPRRVLSLISSPSPAWDLRGPPGAVTRRRVSSTRPMRWCLCRAAQAAGGSAGRACKSTCSHISPPTSGWTTTRTSNATFVRWSLLPRRVWPGTEPATPGNTKSVTTACRSSRLFWCFSSILRIVIK